MEAFVRIVVGRYHVWQCERVPSEDLTVFLKKEKAVFTPIQDLSIANSCTVNFKNSPGDIFFLLEGNEEVLRISPDGFYVRGKLLEQETEPQKVYEAFVEFLRGMHVGAFK